MKKCLSFKTLSLGLMAILCGSGIYFWLATKSYLHIDFGHVNAEVLQVRAREGGILTQLNAEEGSLVEPGAILGSFENPGVLERQRKAQQTLVQLKKNLQLYKNQSEQAMQSYLSDLAVRPQQEVDLHLQTLQEAQEKTNLTQNELGAVQEELHVLQSQSGKGSIYSPCKAVLIKQHKIAGDPILSGESLFTLFDIDHPWIEMEVPEKHLHLLQVGQTADVYLTAYPGQKWTAEISWIGPATVSKMNGLCVSKNAEFIPIKLSLLEKDFPVKPGLSAKARVKVR